MRRNGKRKSAPPAIPGIWGAVITMTALAAASAAHATCLPVPNTLTNGNTADASQVMGDFGSAPGSTNGILACPLFTGSVGINTTTPAAPLDVKPATNGAAIDIAGNNAILLAPDNTSVGVGPQALTYQTASTNLINTAVGFDALAGTTSGVTGSDNVAVGGRSLSSITSGVQNVGVGYEASYALSSGSYSTAVGVVALKYASGSTGNYNTAIGYEAMTGVSGSGLNTANGFNTAVGASAAETIQSGAANNTIIGGQTARGITTGSANTVIGAGVGSQILNTSLNNILIGTDSSTDVPSGEGNQTSYLNIGNAIYGYNLANNANAGPAHIAINTITDETSYAFYVNGAAAGTSAWSNVSDARLKANVTPITDGLATVERLRGVRFTWRAPADRTVGKTLTLPVGKPDIGFIAQEVAAVVPEAVDAPKDPAAEPYSLKDDKLIPVLVEAIKEQQAEIKQQQVEIDHLKAQVAASGK